MSKVYKLKSDFENYASLRRSQESASFLDAYWDWKHIDKYTPVSFELDAGDNGRKNYKMDISTSSYGFIIFSEKATEVLKDILESTGQMLPIITESKRKKFFGFYPNKNVYDDSIINLKESDYREAKNGRIFSKIVLNNSYPKDDYLFVLKDEAIAVFVTDKFKDLVEKHDLKGFDFSEYREIEVKD